MKLPNDWDKRPDGARLVATEVNQLRQGKLDAVTSVTLDANSATTTVTDARIGGMSAILPVARTANAAAGLASLYVSSLTTGSAVLTHANNAQTDRTYDLVVIG